MLKRKPSLSKYPGWIVAVRMPRSKNQLFLFSSRPDALRFQAIAEKQGARTIIAKAKAA